MSVTRIRFERAIGHDMTEYTQFHIEAPGVLLSDAPRPPLQIDAHKAVFDAFDAAGPDDVVRAAGDALWSCLSAHRNTKEAFRPILRKDATKGALRLAFSDLAGDAKALPWEALRETQAGFLCFDRRIPILREVETETAPDLQIANTDTLRFLAVIGARGDDGQGEWDEIRKALQSLTGSVRFQALILASRQELEDDINALGVPAIRAETIPHGTSALVARIERFGPHVAHLFCHGYAGTESVLEVEDGGVNYGCTKPTWLMRGDLLHALSAKAWLVVLNACSLADVGDAEDTGPGTPETASLCEELVQSGIPVVVGMRGPMLARYTHAFGGTFHERALRAVGQAIAQGGMELDLGACFSDACRAILADPPLPPMLAAARIRDWTFPVMTLRSGPLAIKVIGHGDAPGGASPDVDEDTLLAREEAIGEREVLARILDSRGDVLPDEAVREVRARIAELEAQLGTRTRTEEHTAFDEA
ncbi:CHAT domain-containing protein [Sagittula stellata]|uniref:CHAT domain-containing protein n=1 Tax=Sagittula stellata (strain ATCC 700073 / DSM 11524 / E-37) TaxID=388399 RepID=A3JZR1_SAGS3|nr:CHAT domain-containing protein [Sagittula stellata]EBA09964.1 hypothetical protein SSE37_09148 [Sagittula stellata E-37]